MSADARSAPALARGNPSHSQTPPPTHSIDAMWRCALFVVFLWYVSFCSIARPSSVRSRSFSCFMNHTIQCRSGGCRPVQVLCGYRFPSLNLVAQRSLLLRLHKRALTTPRCPPRPVFARDLPSFSDFAGGFSWDFNDVFGTSTLTSLTVAGYSYSYQVSPCGKVSNSLADGCTQNNGK